MKRKHKEAMLAMSIKIAGLEEIARRQSIMYAAFAKRLAAHDEEIEAMGESIDQRSRCKCGVGNELMGRVKNLEIRTGLDRRLVANHSLRVATLEGKYNRMDAAISALAKEQDERITTLEQSNEKMNDVLGRSLEKIEQALELTNRRAVDVETLQQQIKEINSRLTALTNKYLELRPGKLLCENKPGKLRKVTEKEYRKIVSDTAPVSTRNLLAVKKSGRPRKVNKL